MNRELNADFDLGAFAHRAVWNAEKRRIEAYLVSAREQSITIAGKTFHFRAGETIHTENSHKYVVADFASRAARVGWSLEKSWQSADPEFAVLLFA
jgi:uncharacterized SAM-dependent methyltransferase